MKGAANLLKMFLLSYKGKVREGALGQSKVSLIANNKQVAQGCGVTWGNSRHCSV